MKFTESEIDRMRHRHGVGVQGAEEILRLRGLIKMMCGFANDVTHSEDSLRESIMALSRVALKGESFAQTEG